MTFCLGMIVDEGIVGIADTRLTSGNEIISAKKVSLYQQGLGTFFIMTSGLRSLRDKTLTYFQEAIATRPEPCDRLFKAVNVFAEQIRQVFERLQGVNNVVDAITVTVQDNVYGIIFAFTRSVKSWEGGAVQAAALRGEANVDMLTSAMPGPAVDVEDQGSDSRRLGHRLGDLSDEPRQSPQYRCSRQGSP